jgi:hypothetical protein
MEQFRPRLKRFEDIGSGGGAARVVAWLEVEAWPGGGGWVARGGGLREAKA